SLFQGRPWGRNGDRASRRPGAVAPRQPSRSWRGCKADRAALSLREDTIRLVNVCLCPGAAITDVRSVKPQYPARINGTRDVEQRLTSIPRCNASTRI